MEKRTDLTDGPACIEQKSLRFQDPLLLQIFVKVGIGFFSKPSGEILRAKTNFTGERI